MTPGVLRFPRFLPGPARFGLVLSGLMLAAPVPVGPAGAGEIGAGVSAAPWQGPPAGGGEAGFQPDPAGFPGLAALEFVIRETDEGAPSRGLFFRAGDGLRLGAQGSFDSGSGDLRALIALRLNF
jgi:hypothetical protein